MIQIHDKRFCGDCIRLAPRMCDRGVQMERADHVLRSVKVNGYLQCGDCPPHYLLPPACHPVRFAPDGTPVYKDEVAPPSPPSPQLQITAPPPSLAPHGDVLMVDMATQIVRERSSGRIVGKLINGRVEPG